MARSWEEVKGVLDDPYVSADTKEALLAAYVRENTGPFGGVDDLPDEVEDYTDGTRASYKIDGGDAFAGQYFSTDELYETAQDESDEAGYSTGLNDESVEDGRTAIEDMRLPQEGSSLGVQKSDEIFSAARDALRIFEDFLPVNDRVPSDSLGRQGRLGFETDIVKRYEEQVGISFGNFLDDAARLRAAYGTLSELNATVETDLNNVYREWTGSAANASFRHYSEKIAPNVTDLLEYLQTAPDMIDAAVANIFAACKDKANDVIALYQGMNGTLGSATPDIADKVVTLANGDFDSQDQVLEVAAWVDSVTGSNLESTIRSDDCGLNDENKDYVIRECKKWIRESFNQDLHETLWVSFDQACTDALEAVNSHYEALNTYLTEYENTFTAAQAPPSQPPANQPPPGTPGTPGGPGTPSIPGGPGSPGGPSTPSTPPTPSIPPMPEVPTPPSTDLIETDPNGPGDQDQNDQDQNDQDQNDQDQDDQGNPDVPTTPPGNQEETVTIQDGDREISVTSPDGQGVVTVTVDDGSGQPKTYTLDFGGPGAPGQPGVVGDGPQSFGPDGRPPTAPAPDAPVEPGPDGRCVITDGDLTITAERPEGRPDTVVVTVDDGTGEPTTYNLDYSGSNTRPGDVTTLPGGVTTLPGGVTAVPAPAPGSLPQELVDANRQVDQADFTGPTQGETARPLRGDFHAQPAFAEMPQPLRGDISTQPAFGDGPPPQGQQLSARPAFGELPQQSWPEQHAFATTASAADDPSMSGFGGGGPHSASGEAGAGWFGGQEQSPYMHGSSGEASLPTAPDSAAGDHPGAQAGPDQAHPGMAGGMPMMGGAPGGGGGAGDTERAGGQWRTTGDLFDEPGDPQRLRGAFGGEDR